jgi:DNA/RNA-binding domain of Phe-tRNA-synthetase-like protein
MINLSISKNLKIINSSIALGFIQGEVIVTMKSNALWQEILAYEKFILNTIDKTEIKNLPAIKASRDFYKKLNRDPDRYPLSSEALLKRILSRKSLYQINNIVDINNLISIQSYFSAGTYDLEKIDNEIIFDIGEVGEKYESLGKGFFDLGNLPVFRDIKGSFGSPTSDSKRTCITSDTKQIISIIISFSGKEGLTTTIENASKMFSKYANAKNLFGGIVE